MNEDKLVTALRWVAASTVILSITIVGMALALTGWW